MTEKTDHEIQVADFAERKALAREIFIRMIIAHPHTPGWDLAEDAFDYAAEFVETADRKDPELKD